jgi:hypothetical protein
VGIGIQNINNAGIVIIHPDQKNAGLSSFIPVQDCLWHR